MAKRLRDFKPQAQDSRLVLSGTTVFKVKFRASRELRGEMQVQSRALVIQKDLKVIPMIAAIILYSDLAISLLSHRGSWQQFSLKCSQKTLYHFVKQITSQCTQVD